MREAAWFLGAAGSVHGPHHSNAEALKRKTKSIAQRTNAASDQFVEEPQAIISHQKHLLLGISNCYPAATRICS